jgi:TRAP-type C4-dicarboxylate transport system substrate-binding protein
LSGADYIEHFAAELDRRSDGLVKIEARYQAAGRGVPRVEQQVAGMIQGGQLDLGLLPARAFDQLGVSSLQALQAPFLLTNDDAVDAVLTSDLSADLMSGLPAAGFEGLALWPDALRHPFSFGAPILTLLDFHGLVIRAAPSRRGFDLLKALGARPLDLPDFGPHDVGAAETAIDLHGSMPGPGVFTANITFFPKVQALFANGPAFTRLTAEQRQFVRAAAAATTDWVIKNRVREVGQAAAYCASGGTIVLARDRDLVEMLAAAAPVYADLKTDPLTERLIGQIRNIVAAREIPPVVGPCRPVVVASPSASVGLVPAGDPSVLNGVYRADISAAHLESLGIDKLEAIDNGGIFTLTFKDGQFNHHLDRDNTNCGGPYTVRDTRVTVTVNDECGTFDPLFSATWTLTGGELRFTDIAPAGDVVAQALWGSKPFVRIGDAP